MAGRKNDGEVGDVDGVILGISFEELKMGGWGVCMYRRVCT